MTGNYEQEMIYWLYELMLKRQITELPGHVCFMISGKDMADTPEKLYRATAWCNEISAFVAKHHTSARPEFVVLHSISQPPLLTI